MGFFTKKDADGLPSSFQDLGKELMWPAKKKYRNDQEYKFRLAKKMFDIGLPLIQEDKLGADENYFLDCLSTLSGAYEDGIFCEKNLQESFRCQKLRVDILERQARKKTISDGNAKVLTYDWQILADAYARGKGCPRDPEKARKLYCMCFDAAPVMAGEMGDGLGIYAESSVRPFMEGYPMPGDIFTAEELIRKMIGKGQIKGYNLADDLYWMKQMEYTKLGRSPQEDIPVFQKAAKTGNPYAQFLLAKCLMEGKGVEQNKEEGLKLMMEAGASNYDAADYLCCYYGTGEKERYWHTQFMQLQERNKVRYS